MSLRWSSRRISARRSESSRPSPPSDWAARVLRYIYYGNNSELLAQLAALRTDLAAEFGWKSQLFAALGGPFVHAKLKAEARWLEHGWTYEPPTFYEVNDAVAEIRLGATLCRFVTPRIGETAAGAAADVPVNFETAVPFASK